MTKAIVVAVLVAIAAVLLRAVYIFFPAFNLVDVLVFGVAGVGLARFAPRRWWVLTLVLILPAMAFVATILINLGPANLQRGVGVWHLYSAILIPLAAFFGGSLGARRARRMSAA